MEHKTQLVYTGRLFSIEAYIADNGKCLAMEYLEKRSQKVQAKFAALFVRLADQGKILNEQKFKHLSNTSQIFEFKVNDARILTFFVKGRRLILTHGFTKRAQNTPMGEIWRAEIIKTYFLDRMRYDKDEKLDR